jgi:hypothetical protein
MAAQITRGKSTLEDTANYLSVGRPGAGRSRDARPDVLRAAMASL